MSELTLFVVEHGAMSMALLDHFGGEFDEAREAITDSYLGLYACNADYMQDVTGETISPPSLCAIISTGRQ